MQKEKNNYLPPKIFIIEVEAEAMLAESDVRFGENPPIPIEGGGSGGTGTMPPEGTEGGRNAKAYFGDWKDMDF